MRSFTAPRLIAAAVLAVAVALVAAGSSKPEAGARTVSTKTLHSFEVRTNDGKKRSLSEYRGKVVLVVNTASRCGLTPQYEGLESLYQKYHDKGFEILAFPANDFLGQEPGTDAEIQKFCALKYDVTFPVFAKVHVKGRDIAPLYAYLTKRSPFPGDISWNFNKFLVAPDGRVVARWGSPTDPLDPEVTAKVEALLPKP